MYLQYWDHSRKQVRRNKQKNTFINNTAIVHMCTRDILSVALTEDKQTSFLFGVETHRLKFKDCFRWCDERTVETQTARKRTHPTGGDLRLVVLSLSVWVWKCVLRTYDHVRDVYVKRDTWAMSSGLTESQSAQAVPPTHQVKVRSRSSAPLVLERVISCRSRRSAGIGRSWGTPAPVRSGWRSSPRCCTSLWLFLEHQRPEI